MTRSHSVMVSTPPFHGGSRGSNPLGSAILLRSSTIGSASEFGSEGYRFESYLRSFFCKKSLQVTTNSIILQHYESNKNSNSSDVAFIDRLHNRQQGKTHH